MIHTSYNNSKQIMMICIFSEVIGYTIIESNIITSLVNTVIANGEASVHEVIFPSIIWKYIKKITL